MAPAAVHRSWNVVLIDRGEAGDAQNGDGRLELLWKEYFRDPSQWWDKRSSKVDPGYPDFKHKTSSRTLRLDGRHNPPWVTEELQRRGLLIATDYTLHYKKNSFPSHGRDDINAFFTMLKDCGKKNDLKKGIELHDKIVRKGLLHKYADAVAIMYSKCGALPEARELLDSHRSRNLVAWTALIAGYVRHGQSKDALDCADTIQSEGLSPDAVTYACILKACASTRAIDRGVEVHDEIVRQGLLHSDVVLSTSLVDMYAKCGDVAKAQHVLEELPIRDVVTYNAVITGYVKGGQAEQALRCFEKMLNEGLIPSSVTFACVLKVYSTLGDVHKGECIHQEIIKQALLQNDVVLGGALVNMYAQCGALQKAQELLMELSPRDVFAWSSLIAGYAQKGKGNQALESFEEMQNEGLTPDAVTYACVLKACGSIGAIKKGEQIHDKIVKEGLLRKNSLLGSALVDMYAKCGALTKAQNVLDKLSFQDEVCYNALIAGYVQHNQCEEALKCYENLQQKGLSPNAVTFSSLLKACGSLGAVDKGEKIHDEISRKGLLTTSVVLSTALVDMYAKCGALEKAQKALKDLPVRNVVIWNALMTGYAQQGEGKQVLICFKEMQGEGLLPDAVTFSNVLNACSHLGLVEEGTGYFATMRKTFGIEPDMEHCTCMIDLFGRAGQLDKAVKWVQELPSSMNSTLWAALLSACRKWGDVSAGRWAFEQLKRLDPRNAVPYLLMADIYAAAGMQEDAQIIESLRRDMAASQCQVTELV